LATDQEEGNPMYSFEQLQLQYGEMILIRRGLLTKDVVMVTDPKVNIAHINSIALPNKSGSDAVALLIPDYIS
jgi:hypothetical protein